MRIVLDTNVVLSALLWRGTPYRLLQTIRRQEQVQLFTSAVVLAELGEVLAQPVSAKRLALVGRPPHEVLADYADVVELVTPVVIPTAVAADRDDDFVLAAAVAAAARFLVSGDRHLLTLGSYQGIEILTAAETMIRIG